MYRLYFQAISVRRCGAQLGTISVGPGSQSTCTKVCRIRRGAQMGAIGPTGLGPALNAILFMVIKWVGAVTVRI